MTRIIETIGYCMLIVLAVLNLLLHNALLFLWHGDFKHLKPMDIAIFRVYITDPKFIGYYYANPYHYLIDKKTKPWWVKNMIYAVIGFATTALLLEVLRKKTKTDENAAK